MHKSMQLLQYILLEGNLLTIVLVLKTNPYNDRMSVSHTQITSTLSQNEHAEASENETTTTLNTTCSLQQLT